MTYLNKDTLNPDGENILLFELSAYSRMQYIEFMVEERKSLPSEESTPEENFKLATLLTMRDQAMLVALSLSEADEEQREGKDIFPEIIRKYPPGLLGSAALLVRDPLTSLCYAISQGVWTARLARNAFGNVFL